MNNLGKYKWHILGVVLSITLAVWIWKKDPKVTIGVEGKYEVTIKGKQLDTVPYTLEDEMAVRIASVEPKGKGFQYDLRYMAYAPGEHNLANYLITESGEPAKDLREMKVRIKPLLKEDYSGILFDAESKPIDLDTNYSWVMPALWILWLCVPVLLLWHKPKGKEQNVAIAPPTTEQRLHALLDLAKSTSLDVPQQTDLEKLLIKYWSELLSGESRNIIATLEDLRKHPVASEQLASVQHWLHSREGKNNPETAEAVLTALRKGVA